MRNALVDGPTGFNVLSCLTENVGRHVGSRPHAIGKLSIVKLRGPEILCICRTRF